MNKKIRKIYSSLRQKYGKPKEQWRLWCKRPKTTKEKERVIIESILTQRANWKNVELAISNLKKEKLLSLKGILKTGEKNIKKLELLIKPSGFYKQKSEYLLSIGKFFSGKDIPNNIDVLRKELLQVKGVGPETADSIILYALHKPVFVIDEYTRRLAKKEGISKDFSYEYLRELFEKNLPKSYVLYQDFHALIVIDGKNKRK